jgi:hypothetical protein
VLDSSLWNYAGEQQRERQKVDPWEDKLKDHLEAGGSITKKIHVSEILDAVFHIRTCDQTQIDAKRIKNIMTHRLGYEHKAALRTRWCFRVYQSHTSVRAGAAGEGTDLQTDPNITAVTETQRALEQQHQALREPWREICGAPLPPALISSRQRRVSSTASADIWAYQTGSAGAYRVPTLFSGLSQIR